MALVTAHVATFTIESVKVNVNLNYDDNTLRVRSVSGTNNTPRTLIFTATRTSDGASWSTTVLPGDTYSRNLPNNLLDMVVDPDDGSTLVVDKGWTLRCVVA